MEFIIELLTNHPEVVIPFFLNAVVASVKKAMGPDKLSLVRRWIVPATLLLGMVIVYAPFTGENFFFKDVPQGALWLYGACMGFISNGLYSFHKKTLRGK